MTDFDFIKSISNVPKQPVESTIKGDAFGRRAANMDGGAHRPAFTTQASPPWEHEPGTPRNSIGWKMGSGAEYRQHFESWFTGLDDEKRETFMREHPEPEGWRGFYGSLIEGD
ncbi:hypothetical protein [Kordiimonas lacus]|uniref:Uncharacterized protein n=1 Tax=Kordiimonas lacus TaxID=637679 RepID=A0A1G6ZHD8_9PROT|nr:hypothetical protein [Kordiimonas lacus]SDE01881.1 hypothetical protein SAMN04488071_1812 [Kordiimonas lacus]